MHNGKIISNAKQSTANYPVHSVVKDIHRYLGEINELYFDVVTAVDSGCTHAHSRLQQLIYLAGIICRAIVSDVASCILKPFKRSSYCHSLARIASH